MKTAVSIPDPIFEAAERVARRRGWSRSELYARAVAELVARIEEHDVTQRLNEVYGSETSASAVDPGWASLQARAIGRDEGW